jgi:nickel transport protein
VFAWVEDETVHTESYFPGGKVVHGGILSVYDSNGELLLTGETDEEGMFSFAVPKRDALTIVLDASMGHRATFVLSREELGLPLTAPSAEAENGLSGSGNGETDDSQSKSISEITRSPGDFAVTSEDIRRIVQEEVSKQLSPLAATLNRLAREERVSPGDVIAGIGYIVGLMGLVMFIYSRKKG